MPPMILKYYLTTLLMLIFSTVAFSQEKKFKIHTVGFYNMENLFDTINDPTINDEEWLPNGAQNWTSSKYRKKVSNMARVIAEIGTADNPNSPTILGVSEIENRSVLEDLIKQPALKSKNYGIVHFDSPDKRGIDVGLIYQKEHFKPITSHNVPLYIYQNNTTNKKTEIVTNEDDVADADPRGRRVYTRDQLLVTGLLDGEEVSFIVCHWPSRSGGEKRSSPFREAAAQLSKRIVDSLQTINKDAKVFILGDLNDGSFNKSVKVELGAKGKKSEVKPLGIYNPFEEMANKGMGTIAYRDSWDIFDIIMFTQPLIETDYSSYRYWKAGIYNAPYMITTVGQYKGYPLRHTATEVGFSDHFPVFIYLIKEQK